MTNRYLLIAVAKSLRGAELFDLNQESDGDVYKWELEMEDYKILTGTGVFDELNNKCGSLIGSYEDNKICEGELLIQGMLVVGSLLNIENDAKRRYLLEPLAAMFVVALSVKTCIYFYF